MVHREKLNFGDYQCLIRGMAPHSRVFQQFLGDHQLLICNIAPLVFHQAIIWTYPSNSAMIIFGLSGWHVASKKHVFFELFWILELGFYQWTFCSKLYDSFDVQNLPSFLSIGPEPRIRLRLSSLDPISFSTKQEKLDLDNWKQEAHNHFRSHRKRIKWNSEAKS